MRPWCRTRVGGRDADDYFFGQAGALGETPTLAGVVLLVTGSEVTLSPLDFNGLMLPQCQTN